VKLSELENALREMAQARRVSVAREWRGRSLIETYHYGAGASVVIVADELQGQVVGIADGDTVTVLDASDTQHKIRLKSIDAPERGQAFGQASKRNLSALIFGKLVTIQFSKRDRYGRIVGRVIFNGQDICLEQVRSGYAWHYTEYEREQSPAERRAYAEAEAEAREQKRGLWRDSSPVAPWDYRRERRKAIEGQRLESERKSSRAGKRH